MATHSSSLSTSGQNAPAPAKPLEIEAFDALRAEAEPWLAQAFEAPPEFDLVSGSRSCIVFGEPGTGKSALHHALSKSWSVGNQSAQRLIAEWRPRAPADNQEPAATLIKRHTAEIFDACAFSTICYLAEQATLFADAPKWAQRVLHWFIQHYLRGDFEVRTGVLQRNLDASGQKVLRQLMLCPERELFTEDAAPEEIIAQLVVALAEVEIQGVWVLVAPVDSGDEDELVRLAVSLRPFLSRLNLFEQTSFAFKIFLAQSARGQLANVNAIERRRLGVHYLQWTSEKLAALLVKRMELATGDTLQNLEQICSDQHLLKWLERCGGMKPRGWLEQFRPLASAYLGRHRQGQKTPISPKEWQLIRQRHPPRLAFDREQKIVQVEERKIELTEEQFKIFNYLYDHPGKVCSRSQLYYLAYRGWDHEARTPGDDGYEAPTAYRGLIETAIWRLRQNIEPYEGEEIFIVTVKKQGYRLDHT